MQTQMFPRDFSEMVLSEQNIENLDSQ